jgi:predicted Rossmann-fold nucleotide-binding protein
LVSLRRYVAVVGPGDASEKEMEAAEAVGRELAERGAVVVSGGLGGVMAAASKGATDAGGPRTGHSTNGISIFACVPYSGYVSGKAAASRRSSTLAL